MKVCSEPGCPNLQPESRCPEHRRERERARGSREARGYGSAHRKRSKMERAAAVGKVCHLCGQPMLDGEDLALDHTVDRQGYRGVVHLSCNSRDGGIRAHQHP